MEGMHGHGGGSGGMMAANASAMHPHKRMMMHMTFFWGKNAEVLFSGWPGTSSGMYALSLIFVFFLCAAVEWLSHGRLIGSRAGPAAGMARTAMHAARMGAAYLAMLAIMSFNGGVFLAAVAGHAVGFLVFGSRAFTGASPPEEEAQPMAKRSDLPPMTC